MIGLLSRTSRSVLLTTKQSGHLMKGIVALICALALAKADPVRTNIASYDETDPKQAPAICAIDNSDGILVAHENCNQFYQCWDGLPIARDCYGNLHYNPTTEICDWPDNVNCGGRLIPQDTGTNENDNEVSEKDDHGGNGSNGAGNCDPSQAGSICAQVGSDGTFVAHENCNNYYICDNGVPVVQRCPGTLLFDPFKDYCDWPESVDCGDRVCEEREEDNGHSENGDNDNSGNVGTGAGNCDPSQARNICAIEGSEGTLVAHEHCNKYYICANGSPAVQKCPGTLLFDPFKDYCDWPSNVECGDRIICDDSAEDTNNSENGGNNDGGSVGTGAGNCDPSQVGNICAAEGSDGVLVAHENCNKYYICSHGVPVVQRCPGTLLFDPFKDYCDWPENVDCGDRVLSESSEEDINETENGDSGNGGSISNGAGNCDPSQAGNICATEGSDGILVAHENCNKYYICSHGVPVVQKCSGTLLFDPFKDYCDWPGNVDCGDRVIFESSEEDTNETGNGDSDNGGSIGTGAGNCDPSQAGNICTAEGSDGVLVAHENCNKYYICNHGVPVVQRCPGVLLFDPFKDYCDWPENVDCGDRVISEDKKEEETNESSNNENNGIDNDKPDNVDGATCNCNPGEAPEICLIEGSDGTFVAHEICNRFYTCASGKPVAMACPSNTLFNPYTQQCDWPENVDCGERVIQEIESEENNNDSENQGTDNGSSDSGGSDSEGSGTCNCNPGEAPAICAIDGSDNTLVAHENCNQFYTCAAGRPVTLTCPGTTLYNPYTEQCDWPENVECGERVVPEVNSEEDDGKNEETDANSSESEDSNGSDNGGSDNGGAGTCNCNPGEAPAICAIDGSDNTLVAHENCNQFYTCAAGRPVTLTCPGTTLYNPYTEQCDWPENVECGERVVPEVNSEEDDGKNEETDANSSESEDSNGSDNGGSDNGGAGTCNCNPGEAPAICAIDGSDNTLVAHEHCNQFYTCAAGRPVTLTCPGTTLYNPYTEQCDWPENVECGERVVPEVNSEEDDEKNEETDANSSESEDSDTNGSDNGGSDIGCAGTCNCNPGEAPAICAIDGSDNTLVAHENCNQFYTCAAGRPVTLTCPGTTLYNPHTEQCDWPENVECGERVVPEVNSEEDDGKNEETDANSSESEDSDTNGSDNGGSDNGGAGTCNCNPGEAPAICAIDGSDNTFVAHENCNQFYTCAAGRPVTLTCPGTTLYNPYTEQCDWPENVECGERVVPEVNSEEDDEKNEETDANSSESEDSDTNGSDNGGSDNGGAGTCNCNPGEAPAICAINGSDNTLVAHENCNQFYTCAAGRPVTLTCPGTTLYNPYTEQCDWPENVECGERVVPEVNSEEDDEKNEETDANSSESEDSDTNESDNGSSDNGSAGTCNCNPGEAPAICAIDGSDNTLVAHENCNQFYTCAAGRPVTLTCPGTTLYNPYTEQCDWPENVECGERVVPEVNSEEDDEKNEETDANSSESEDSDTNGSDNGGSDNGGAGTCNCNPGEAPAICAIDGSDNTLVAHENCNQFYTCAAGRPVTLTCPGTTLYNPYTEQCDWPENVECGERVVPEVNSEEDYGKNEETDANSSESEDSDTNGSDNGGSDNGGAGTCNCNPGEAPAICAIDGSDNTFVAHENCNQFYTCAAGRPVTLTCPGTTLYNPYTEQCDWPENVECGERVVPEVNSEEDDGKNEETDANSSESEDSDTNGSDNGGSDNGGAGTCNCNPGEAPAICAIDGSDNTLVAHENCNQFYTCAAGRPVTLTCPGTTLYNPYTEQCDWPENVECGERVVPEVNSEEDDGKNEETDANSSESEDSDTNGSDNGGSDNGGAGTCNCNPGEAPAICAIDGSDNTFVAHENCNQFYTCAAGRPVTLTCPGTTLYNPYTEQCDWPENVECGERVVPEVNSEEDDGKNEETDANSSESEDSDTNGSDNGGSDNGGAGTCNCNPGEAPAICAIDGSDNTLVAHENCNQFYTCAAGRPVTLTCPGTTLYNPYTEQCDWPEKVECGERVVPEGDTEEDNNGNGEADNNSSESENSDNGSTDNGGSGTCNCSPGEAPAICAVDGSDGILVAHENCNQFYTCVAGQPATLACPGSTLYNPYTQQCDWPENVECGDRIITDVDCDEDDNENGETDTDNSSESDGSDNGGSDNGGSNTCNCNPGEAPAICAVDGSDGIMVAHENCNQFYTCVAGQPATLTCPGSTLYNPYTQQCDWPEKVECGERVISEVDTEEDNNGNGEADNNSSESEDSDNGGSDNGGSGTCNCNPGEAPAICAVDGSDGILVAHENCNQFYTCVAGQPATLACPGSTLYNPYTQQCDWPENVECGDRIITDVDCDEDDNENGEIDTDNSSESDGSDNGGSDNGGSNTCNCNPGEAPAICAVDGSDGIMVAHENCNQFYTCVAGQPATLTCPGSTLYNPYTQQCDWPEKVECGERVISEVDTEEDNNGNGEADNNSSESEDSDNGGSDNGGSGTCNCNPGEAPAICTADGSDGTLVAHENCNQFYTCVAGQPTTLACPGSTLYNPYTQQCDWPENVECGDRIIPEIDCNEDDNENGETDTDNSSESEGSDNGGSDNGGSGTCNCNPGEAPAICAADGSDGTFVAHENCNQFYSCVAGQPATLTCPGSTLYNPYSQQCDWPENVNCGDRLIPEVDCEDNNEEDQNESGSDNGSSSEIGDLDNGSSENGDSDDGISSESEVIDNGSSENGDLDESEEDNNTNEENENEGTGSESSESDVSDNESDNSAPDNEDSENEDTDNEISDSCNCNPAEAPVICAAFGSDGIMVAHENCNQFYTCFAGEPITLTCTGTTLYNPNTQRCDWPDNVSCGDRTNSQTNDAKNENNDANEDLDSEELETGNIDADVFMTCAESNSEGVFLPSEKCNQFYVCIGSKPVIMTCSGNLLYNYGEKRCDWPENVNCGSRIIPSEDYKVPNVEADDVRIVDVLYDDDEETKAELENESEFGYDIAVIRCADGNSAGAMVPHEECHRFYICLANRPVVFTCTSENLYDIEIQQCNYPQNVNCGGRVLRTV